MSSSIHTRRTLHPDVARARPARPYAPSLHHGRTSSRPRFSHEHHVDDKTLLNDTEEENQKALSNEHKHEDADGSEPGDGDAESFFPWDSEHSLFFDLMDEGQDGSEEGGHDALVESLRAPFDQKKREIKRQVAGTFVPVIQHVEALHQEMSERYDAVYGKGLHLFNTGCKALETATVAEYQDMVEAYETITANIANLMEQVKAEYAHQDGLWADLEAKTNEIADSAIADIQAAPGQLERTIAKLEKYYQSMDKTKETVLSEKQMKELMSKYASLM